MTEDTLSVPSSCELPPSDLQGPSGAFKVSQVPPTKADLARVAELPVLDAEGKPHAFKTLWQPTAEEPNRRVLLLFVRHFFCGNCQEFLRTLCESLNPQILANTTPPTSVAIVGCGQPDLISFYKRTTECPYPIYADPTKKLYAELGMYRTLDLGPARPDNIRKSFTRIVLSGAWQALKEGKKATGSGDMRQVGGEFLIESGQVKWCHRMCSTRDHAPVDTIVEKVGLSDQAESASTSDEIAREKQKIKADKKKRFSFLAIA